MGEEAPDWRETAKRIYRLARSEILSLKRLPATVEAEYYVEELREALFDLKESTIAEDPDAASKYANEVMLLLVHLHRLESEEEPS